MSIDELDLGARTDIQVPETHPDTHLDSHSDSYPTGRSERSIVLPSRFFSGGRHCGPWPAEWASAHLHEARIECRPLRAGAISRLRCLPAASNGLAADIERPREDSVYLMHVISGELTLEHDGQDCVVGSGGVIAFEAARHAQARLAGRCRHDIVALVIPAHRLVRHGVSTPLPVLASPECPGSLPSSLSLVAKHMLAASEDELEVLFDASVSLLALAARDRALKTERIEMAEDNAMLRAVLAYVEQNLATPALSPVHVAQRFAISTRYLHKLFGKSGSTFCAYVLNRRLDQIRGELASGPTGQPIAALAQKWGFADISTFNRAFKKRFGVTPRRVRAGARL